MAYDGAYHSVHVVADYNICAEGGKTWAPPLDAAAGFLPWFNKPENTLVTDGEKAAKSTLARKCPHVNHFFDYHHLNGHVAATVPRPLRSTARGHFREVREALMVAKRDSL